MIIPSENLEIDTIYNQKIVFKGGLLKIRLVINPNNSNEIFVQEVDSLNNVRTSQTFSGFDGFWKAVEEFEKKIEDAMGWKEVFGFEVGMVIKLEKDTKKYAKGTYLMITEVDSNGKAVGYQKLNQGQVQKISKNKYVTKLTKAVGIEELKSKGINSFSDLKIDKEYDFDLMPSTQMIIPNYQMIDGFQIGDKVNIDVLKGGGDGVIEQIVLVTDENKKSRLNANIRLEDGSLGMIPLVDVEKPKIKEKEVSKPKKVEQKEDLSDLPSTDSRVWNETFEKGDLVKVRKDFEELSRSKGSTMVIKWVRFTSTKRPQNPTGKLYEMDNGEKWEGKDLTKVF